MPQDINATKFSDSSSKDYRQNLFDQKSLSIENCAKNSAKTNKNVKESNKVIRANLTQLSS